MASEIAEDLCIDPVKIIHTACAKALRMSKIISDDLQDSKMKIEKILESIVKVQDEIINMGENSRI